MWAQQTSISRRQTLRSTSRKFPSGPAETLHYLQLSLLQWTEATSGEVGRYGRGRLGVKRDSPSKWSDYSLFCSSVLGICKGQEWHWEMLSECMFSKWMNHWVREWATACYKSLFSSLMSFRSLLYLCRRERIWGITLGVLSRRGMLSEQRLWTLHVLLPSPHTAPEGSESFC